MKQSIGLKEIHCSQNYENSVSKSTGTCKLTDMSWNFDRQHLKVDDFWKCFNGHPTNFTSDVICNEISTISKPPVTVCVNRDTNDIH